MKPSFLSALALLVCAAPTAHGQTTVSLGLRLGVNRATRAGDNPTYVPLTSNGTPVPNATQDYQRTALLAPQFGAVLDVRRGRWAVQPAVLFSQKGADQRLAVVSSNSFPGNPTSTARTNDSFHTISRPNYLEIPFNVVFTPGADHGFQLFAGPYVAFGLGGRAEFESESLSTISSASGTSSSYSSYGYGATLFQYKDDYPGPPPNYPGGGLNGFGPGPTPFAATSGYALARRFDAGLTAGVGYRRGPVQVQLGYGLGLVNQQPGKAATHRDDLPAYYQRVVQLTATYFVKTN